MSASMIGKLCSFARRAETVDLPVAIPPVSPITVVGCYLYYLCKLVKLVTEHGVNRRPLRTTVLPWQITKWH
jgi:hypothetical protein